ncbi:hypothetical protein [uncultured Psychroserpens sp.]|uniref:hypothetical protein n=1 Tax=uncultured Psychroserpens sp. TaxID=255436 RepID=UPI00262747F7|nr:hypothetical protein [uncultured Psychroserpens sp.]
MSIKKNILVLTTLCLSMVVSLSLEAQNDTAQTQDYSSDSKSPQALIDAYYDCISGPIGDVRDFERLRHMFHKDARLIYSYWNEDSSKANLMIFDTIDAFIDKLGYLDKKGFYEHEIANITHSFSTVTQVFSTYKYRAEDNSIPKGQGITSYDLFFDGERYWIMSMFWAAENDKYKIPKKYLKN